MQASLETLGQLERRLNIAVPVADIDSEIHNRLVRLTRTVRMHGFRPGKVPLKVVVQQYGGQVRQEVIGDTLQKAFGEAVRENNLKVAGYPKFDPKPLTDGAADFECSATFEVYPEVTLGDLSNAVVTRPEVTVGDAEVDETVGIMRKQRATYTDVERPAQDGDRITLDYHGTIDGEPFAGGHAHDQAVVLGEGRLLPDFETQITGMKAGDQKQFELRFPEDYHAKETAGKTALFDVTVKRIAEPRLPEVDADFAKSLGVEEGDISRMRTEIKANVEREAQRRVNARIKDQVMQVLLDTTRIDVPKSLVDMEAERMAHAARHDLAARGVKVDDNTQIPVDVFTEQARRRVTLGLILGEAVRVHSLEAKPEQVKALVEEQAQSYEHPAEVVKWFYQSRERLGEIESLVLENNVVEWVLGQVKIENKPTAFGELMGNQS
jgi:trigger factor